MTTMLTWQAEDGQGLEGTRLLLGAGSGFRALGRLVRTGPDGDFTASYRLVVTEGGTVERVSLTTATAQRERHLTMNRTEDGFWLLDTGNGGTRAEFGGAVDVDLAHSPMFNTVPIRRLGLHTEAAEHSLPMVFVTLPELEVAEVEQVYSTASVLDDSGAACIGFRWDDFSAELTVDADGVVQHYPGVATRLSTPATP
ncbi:putative glycolipid-binding domain-containing protein [Pseudonocardia petroleophila]|uniref:Glycolipid-binding domain-containing protein n=2 Tax=Pseudonocardia petroleophila TaxID=37331 RepID=A0A7G7MLJ5_9PSEU|nr:putative glycolipid-binding domain-containing protein [Pseudonocardia petroleophila]